MIARSDPALGFDRLERRGIRVAELGGELLPHAIEHVARVMATLRQDGPPLSEANWAGEFWRRLYRRLATARGSVPVRAFDRRGYDENLSDGDDDPLEGPAAFAHVEAALRALSSPQRFAFLLRVWENHELPAVAAALDLPVAAAKAELFHALQRLHASLAPGSIDRRWVLRCLQLLDEWALHLEPASLAPLAVVPRAIAQPASAARSRHAEWVNRFGLAALLAGAVVLGWRGVAAWRDPLRAPSAPGVALAPAAPSPAVRELAPVVAPDYELLADAEQFALLRDLDFHAWHAREHANE